MSENRKKKGNADGKAVFRRGSILIDGSDRSIRSPVDRCGFFFSSALELFGPFGTSVLWFLLPRRNVFSVEFLSLFLFTRKEKFDAKVHF